MPETVHTQVHPRVMTGLQVDRPVHPSENGLVYVSQTDISVWDAFANAGAGAWRAAADTPAAAGWPDYVVSKGDPVAPFSTIQSAINAATLTGVEQLVLVHPGTYVEDITMAARVRVIGLPTVAAGVGALISSDVIIQGTVEIDNATDSFTFLLANIQVQPTVGNSCVRIQTAALKQNYCFQNCALIADGAAAVVCESTSGDGTLQMRNCMVQSGTPGAGAIFCNNSINGVLEDVNLVGGSTALTAALLRGGVWNLNRVTFSGACIIDGGTVNITNGQLTVSGANGFTLDVTANLKITGLNYSIGVSDNLVAGTGASTRLQGLNSINTTAANNVQLNIAAAVVQAEPPYNARGNVKTTLNGAGPFTIVPADEVYITPSAAAIAVLPQAAKFIHGARTTIITNGAFNVEIQTFAGDKIDNLTNGTFTLPSTAITSIPLLPSVELQCDANLPGWFVVSQVQAVPSNPAFFVDPAGNDQHSGTSASPLATVSEALRRLTVSRWSGQPTITVNTGTINEGANPIWNVPAPQAGASPVLIIGTFAQTLGSTAPTGGTAGTAFSSPPALATITSGAAGGANTFRGQTVRFTGGALSGVRAMVDANDGAGGFTLTGLLATAPVAGTTFVVENQVSLFTWTGTLQVNIPAAGLLLYGLDFENPSGSILQLGGGRLITSACRFKSVGACNISFQSGLSWMSGDGGTLVTPSLAIPASMLLCGDRFDGTAGIITIGATVGGQKTNDGDVVFSALSANKISVSASNALGARYNTVSFWNLGFVRSSTVTGSNCSFIAENFLFDSMVDSGGSPGGCFQFADNSFFNFSFVVISTSPAGKSAVASINARGLINGLSGANAGAGTPVVAQKGSSIRLATQPTITGGTGGQEVQVGANAATTWANAFGGLIANSTDVAAASSQLVRVGP